MIVTSTGALRSDCAANSPPKPEPMMTTRGRPLDESFAAGTCAGDVVMMFPSSHLVGSRLLLDRSDPGHSRCPQRLPRWACGTPADHGTGVRLRSGSRSGRAL